jgi:hypothetical protein
MAACTLELQPHPLGPAGPEGLRLWGELELLNSEEVQTSAPNPATPATPGTAAVKADCAGSAGSGTPRPSGPAALRLTLELDAPPTDPPGNLLLPDAGSATAGQRLDGLWQHTCLECFLGAAGQEAYWEFNLAPGGDWNVYALDGYRQGLRPEPSVEHLPFDCRWQSSTTGGLQLQLQLQAALPPRLAAQLASSNTVGGKPALEWNVTAVLEQCDGTLSYWAVAHRPEPADFHWRPAWRRLALG